ncbi:MAG: hypothetical protein ACREF7_04850 [Candidatus Saccharimonadales bacterium]
MPSPTKEYTEALQQLFARFQKNPYNYFSECELQYDFYCVLKASKLINEFALSNDGVSVNTVHPEYPSVNRVQLKDGKGYRVWFDLAVLNPDFIKSNSYKTVWARDERIALSGTNNVLAAFEFKFFPNNKKTRDLSSVQVDCLKLSLCEEIADRYVLVFSNYEVEKSDLGNIRLGMSKLFWVTPNNVHALKPKVSITSPDTAF